MKWGCKRISVQCNYQKFELLKKNITSRLVGNYVVDDTLLKAEILGISFENMMNSALFSLINTF